MRVEIAKQKRGLEEDQAGDPDGGRSAQEGSSWRAAMGSTRKSRNEPRKMVPAKSKRSGDLFPSEVDAKSG